jgi:hypothetical protein
MHQRFLYLKGREFYRHKLAYSALMNAIEEGGKLYGLGILLLIFFGVDPDVEGGEGWGDKSSEEFCKYSFDPLVRVYPFANG